MKFVGCLESVHVLLIGLKLEEHCAGIDEDRRSSNVSKKENRDVGML